MQFKKFASLENSYRDKYINEIRQQFMTYTGRWAVLEKLHGANFAFYYNVLDGTMRTASRNNFVDGGFYNCQVVIDRYADDVAAIARAVNAESGATEIIIYGELYGAGIQSGVHYGEKDFRAFDIVADGVPLPFVSTLGFVGNAQQLKTVPVLKIYDTLDAALAVNETFTTKLTVGDFNTPNFAEGITIVPADEALVFASGSRVWIKKKTAAFSEKKKPDRKPEPAMSSAQQQLFENITEYLTEARVANVISKFGAVTTKDFGKILGATIQDAYEDFCKDNDIADVKEYALQTLEDAEWKAVSKAVSRAAPLVVRSEFVKHVE